MLIAFFFTFAHCGIYTNIPMNCRTTKKQQRSIKKHEITIFLMFLLHLFVLFSSWPTHDELALFLFIKTTLSHRPDSSQLLFFSSFFLIRCRLLTNKCGLNVSNGKLMLSKCNQQWSRVFVVSVINQTNAFFP